MEFLDETYSQRATEKHDYYKILGCDEFSDTEQIIAEYRIKAKQLHPDKNQGEAVAACTEEFAKLQVAKDVLTDSKMRKEYDTWKRSGMAMCFDQWLAMRSSLKMSMHWAVPTNRTPTIKLNTETEATSSSSYCGHGSENFSEILKKFRNYEI